uniref:Hdr-like menaquinol-oxidizing enzyme, subunit A (HmeA) n=1 Tax=uncultured sulfate-reducing bacterium TaxID=153939 RepID=Q3IBR7_9BACT|nr:Hdr-like menaquinol-oxidizing enzyme, subunit A (HmeA) [uncultured sulfate-reducing bacterium]
MGLGAIGAAGGVALPVVASRPDDGSSAGSTGGKRLAMVIDLRKFRSNDALLERLVDACHRIHNVPDFDSPKDEVKWLWSEDFETVFHDQEFHFIRSDLEGKPTLILCNHCDNPPCTRVCPTEATWKRESDGVVMMDWHRCIGCRYCIVACPYGSRSFNFKDPRTAANLAEPVPTFPTRMRGVVEKCNFCEERLAKGQQPACVEACDDDQIVFGDLNDPESKVRRLLGESMAIRRKPGLGTQPAVYYIIDDPETLESSGGMMFGGVKEGDHA